ncbi:hypothetical protein V3H18_10630 [Methylocystis sp. 9N]|uniref:Uncharacterized protein n=1 Tax=Methylocystis borbori TaxID=3118750 RepID=A0ABU7XHX8_9HYPH
MGKHGANKTKPNARRQKSDPIRGQSSGEKQTLAEFLMNSPLRGSDIDLERIHEMPREIDFGFEDDEDESGKES